MAGSIVEVRNDNLLVIARALPRVVGAILEKRLADAEADAKQPGHVPIKTGYLRSTIGHRMVGLLGGDLYALADYAGYVEYGTIHMAARPFLTPAAARMYDAIADDIVHMERALAHAANARII